MLLKKDYLATIEITAVSSIKSVLIQLAKAFNGFEFFEDTSGRFEEVPAFVAKNGSVNLTLFGIPEDEESDVYILELSCDESMDRDAFEGIIGSELMNILPVELVAGVNGYTDISSCLVSYINSVSNLECSIAE